jgi:hypothetical protein
MFQYSRQQPPTIRKLANALNQQKAIQTWFQFGTRPGPLSAANNWKWFFAVIFVAFMDLSLLLIDLLQRRS